MSLFKNSNESAYTDGKKHFTDVIKNSAPADVLLWKQPEEDFNTNSTLIVMPGEQAIFVHCGVIEQIFDNGTYKLSTENYPFISRLRNFLSGGISVFNCVIYFVRKADSREIKWGTDTPIQIRDKVWGIRTDAKVRGAYKIRIENPEIFLDKLIGSNRQFETQDGIEKYFSGEMTGKIKSIVSRFFDTLERELIGLEAYMDELSDKITPLIDEMLVSYGVRCVKFSLAAIDIDKSKYDAMDEAQIASVSKMKIAQGDKAAMNVLGDDWSRQQTANILGNMSRNQGMGGMAGVGVGIGMGMATSGAFAEMAQQMFKPANRDLEEKDTKADPLVTLEKLKKMLEAGLIEQQEYDAKKSEILSKM